MTVVLPRLATNAPSAVLADLRTGETNADPAGKIGRAIEYSHGKLNPALQFSLLLLAPFTAVIPTGAFGRYKDLLLRDKNVKAVSQAGLDGAVAEAIRLGLATPHPKIRNVVQVQPVLPYFLRSRLQDRPALRDAAELAHYELHCELSRQLEGLLRNGNDPRQRATGLAFAKANYANFSAALGHGLRTGHPIGDLIGLLAEYLREIHQYDSCRKLIDETIAAYPEPIGLAQQWDLAFLHDQAGATAATEHRFGDTKRHYGVALQIPNPQQPPSQGYGLRRPWHGCVRRRTVGGRRVLLPPGSRHQADARCPVRRGGYLPSAWNSLSAATAAPRSRGSFTAKP